MPLPVVGTQPPAPPPLIQKTAEPHPVSLVDTADPPQEILDSTDPVQLIRYASSSWQCWENVCVCVYKASYTG